MQAQIIRRKINSLKLFFVNQVRACTRSSLQYLFWLKSKTVKIYSVVQSVKLLLVLSIYQQDKIPVNAHLTTQQIKQEMIGPVMRVQYLSYGIMSVIGQTPCIKKDKTLWIYILSDVE